MPAHELGAPASVHASMAAVARAGTLTPMVGATRLGASVLTRATGGRVMASPAAMLETAVSVVPAHECRVPATVHAPMAAATRADASVLSRVFVPALEFLATNALRRDALRSRGVGEGSETGGTGTVGVR